MNLLKFSVANDKLRKLEARTGMRVYSFSIPAGFTCPGAKDCLSRFNRKLGKMEVGRDTEFQCYAATLEQMYPALRAIVDWNLNLLIQAHDEARMTQLIVESIGALKDPGIIRVHVAGDYFSATYFRAWMDTAAAYPQIRFYSYTKSVKTLTENEGLVPANFSFTCSEGGKFDAWIGARKTARVVFSEAEAYEEGLEIDHDDWHACYGTESFALLLHGQQQKGSVAAKALAQIVRAK